MANDVPTRKLFENVSIHSGRYCLGMRLQGIDLIEQNCRVSFRFNKRTSLDGLLEIESAIEIFILSCEAHIGLQQPHQAPLNIQQLILHYDAFQADGKYKIDGFTLIHAQHTNDHFIWMILKRKRYLVRNDTATYALGAPDDDSTTSLLTR